MSPPRPSSGSVLVIAPHPDDEVLGVGGTIARLVAEGRDVFAAIVTRGDAAMFGEESVEKTRREANEAHELLGVTKSIFLDGFPAALLDTVPQHRLNSALAGVLEDVDPEVIFVPFVGDLHRDHQYIFQSLLVAARPHPGRRLRSIYAYETLSETNWNAPPLTPGFAPNAYLEITSWMESKLAALRIYESQLRPWPHERSIEAVRALAQMRGATVGYEAAEAFMLIRAFHKEGNPTW